MIAIIRVNDYIFYCTSEMPVKWENNNEGIIILIIYIILDHNFNKIIDLNIIK